MDVSRLEQIERLYQAAADCPAEDRIDFLDRECGGDPVLRLEVESLLRYHDSGSVFLDESPVSLVADVFHSEETALAGQNIGNYAIKKLLGVGGMGEVYLAEDVRLHRPVALKVLPETIVDDPDRLLRFEREARTASALNHPNILTVHEFGESDGLHFIASEFIDGTTLRQKMLGGRLKIDEILEIAIQTTSALAAAHEAGISHRDIKPENIMLRHDGYVKIVDFGLAKLRQVVPGPLSPGTEDPTRALLDTEPGIVMGTDAYMSPEQARGRPIDQRTDIWSVGVVIYEMLAGRRPFMGETRADTIASILTNEPAPLSSVADGIPAELQWIVSKSLTKDADGRYQTAKELQADLKKIKRSLELAGREAFETAEVSGISGGPGLLPARSTNETAAKTEEGNDRATDGGGASGRILSLAGSFAGNGHGSIIRSLFAAALLIAVSAAGLAIYFGLVSSRQNTNIDSIAVLPFENLTGNSDLTYVSDGLSESLIDDLAAFPGIKVISRRSSFSFRGSDTALRDISSRLGARAIVTGSVTQVGDELALRFDVVDGLEDRHLGGGQFKRKAGDLLGFPNEMLRTVVDSIGIRTKGDPPGSFAGSATEDAEAFRFYLNGLVALNGPDGARGKALEHFERAVQLDPRYAAAYVEIAWIHWVLANGSEDPDVHLPKARAAMDQALAIDPGIAKAYVLRALLFERDLEWKKAEDSYRRAISLNPNLEFARNNFAFFLSVMGRHDEALAELEEQRSRDPIDERLHLLQKGIIYSQARRFDEAISVYREAQATEPGREIPQFSLGYAYGGKDLYSEAAALYKRSVERLGGEARYSQPLVYLAASYVKIPEKKEEGRRLLNRIEMMEAYRSPSLLAIVHGALGEKDKAFELLNNALDQRDPLLRFIATGYEYDDLRSDPRFAELMRKIGFQN